MNNTIAKTHISLNVQNVERSVAFYTAFFGVSAHKRRPGYANFAVENPPLKLALEEVGQTLPAGRLSHLGIQVGTSEEVADTKARLETSGVVMFVEGDTVCCYSRQDKLWVTDPDGNSWEVYVLLDEMNETADDHFDEHGRVARTQAETSCCSSAPQTISLTVGKPDVATKSSCC